MNKLLKIEINVIFFFFTLFLKLKRNVKNLYIIRETDKIADLKQHKKHFPIYRTQDKLLVGVGLHEYFLFTSDLVTFDLLSTPKATHMITEPYLGSRYTAVNKFYLN